MQGTGMEARSGRNHSAGTPLNLKEQPRSPLKNPQSQPAENPDLSSPKKTSPGHGQPPRRPGPEAARRDGTPPRREERFSEEEEGGGRAGGARDGRSGRRRTGAGHMRTAWERRGGGGRWWAPTNLAWNLTDQKLQDLDGSSNEEKEKKKRRRGD